LWILNMLLPEYIDTAPKWPKMKQQQAVSLG